MSKDNDGTGSPPTDGDGPACVIVNLPRRDDDLTEADKALIDELAADGRGLEDAKYLAALNRQNKPKLDAALHRHKERERNIERKRKRKSKRKGSGSVPCKSSPGTEGTVHGPPPSNAVKPKPTAAPSTTDHDAAEGALHTCGTPAKSTLRKQHPYEYQSWRNMKQRQKRGDIVDPTWLGVGGFDQFFRDLGRKPSKKYTLDRIDHADHRYGPGLCRWADKKEQTRNRRNTVFLTDRDNVSRSLTEWAEVTGVSRNTLKKRYYDHRKEWTQDQIIYGQAPADASPSAENSFRWPGSDAAQVTWAGLYRLRGERYRHEAKAKFVARWCRGRISELIDRLPPPENEDGDAYPLTPDELNDVERVRRLHATAEKYRRLDDPKPVAEAEPEAGDETDVESELGYYGLDHEYD